MTERQAKKIAKALYDWAFAKGMKPTQGYSYTQGTKPARITVELHEQFNGDPAVPNVKPQVRGGWVDFICPKGE